MTDFDYTDYDDDGLDLEDLSAEELFELAFNAGAQAAADEFDQDYELVDDDQGDDDLSDALEQEILALEAKHGAISDRDLSRLIQHFETTGEPPSQGYAKVIKQPRTQGERADVMAELLTDNQRAQHDAEVAEPPDQAQVDEIVAAAGQD
jgi:hypothetical protein